MVDAIIEITGVDFWQDMTWLACKRKHVPVETLHEIGQIDNAFFEEFTLKKPWRNNICLVAVALSPLARKSRRSRFWALHHWPKSMPVLADCQSINYSGLSGARQKWIDGYRHHYDYVEALNMVACHQRVDLELVLLRLVMLTDQCNSNSRR